MLNDRAYARRCGARRVAALKVLAVGDGYLSSRRMRAGLGTLAETALVRSIDVDPSVRLRLPGLREHQGDPAQIIDAAADTDVLLVHAAPVTASLLDARPRIRLIACARGNPVNIDLAAAAARGVTALRTPAKNADAVADLTLTFVQMLFRGVAPAMRWQRSAGEDPTQSLDSTFAGGRFMAREPRGATLGIIGYGEIGRRVSALAEGSGMRVLATDPYAATGPLVDMEELLERSDALTLHATATEDTRHLLDAKAFRRMKAGTFVVNTSRQSLIDEDALLRALDDSTVGGAALDVCEPDGRWRELARHPRVVMTPHIGGATAQAQQNALDMLTTDILRWHEGHAPLHPAFPAGQ